MVERGDEPVGGRRRLKSWQGWLLLAFAVVLVPLLFLVYIDDDELVSPEAPAGPHPISNALKELSPAERTAALEVALRDSGAGCGRVRRSFFQGHDPKGAAYWNVVCGNGRALSLQFTAEDPHVIRVVECELLEETGLACFTRFGEWV